MLIIVCVLLALVVARLGGGRLSRLAAVRWRRPWLLLAALALQVLVVEVPGLPQRPSDVVHVATYAMAAAFVLANRRVRGLWLLAVGAACNGVTIALNGGTLPASRWALARAGIHEGAGFSNSGVVSHPVLGWLGDVFAVPGPFPLGNVFSVGDVLIVAGATWIVWSASHASPTPPATARATQPQVQPSA